MDLYKKVLNLREGIEWHIDSGVSDHTEPSLRVDSGLQNLMPLEFFSGCRKLLIGLKSVDDEGTLLGGKDWRKSVFHL